MNMYNFLPSLLIIGSLIGILVILARRAPEAFRVQKDREASPTEGQRRGNIFLVSGVFGRLDIPKYKILIFAVLEKSLRRSVILSLRVGNFSTRMIHALRERSQKIAIPYLEELVREREDKSFSEKEASYIEMIKKDPRNIEAYRGLGNLYLEEDNLRDARLSFEEVLKINPEDEEARGKLKRIEKRQERSRGSSAEEQ